MSKIFPARVDQKVFQPSEQNNGNRGWGIALSAAHLQDMTFCLCSVGAVPLSVKLYGRGTDSSHYGLARWPQTGLDHDPDCQYFDDDQPAGDSNPSKPAFDELEDGKIRAHLAVGLGISKGTKVIDRPGDHGKSATHSTRARASESALLQRLWRHASLNVFHGSPRQWFTAVYNIAKAAERIVIDRAGSTLADYLLIGTAKSDKLADAHNLRVLQRCAEKPSRLFVIGRLRQYDAGKARCLLPLKEFHGLPKIMVQTGQLDRFVSARPFLRNLLSNATGFVIVLACIEPDGRDWWKLVSLSGLTTSPNMIPADSSFEVEFEHYLASHARKFIKPMVNSEIDQDGNRPDYILLDTQPRTRCEVWGMQTPEYLAGKESRMAAFAKRGQALVSWSANPREPFPRLPEPVLRKQ